MSPLRTRSPAPIDSAILTRQPLPRISHLCRVPQLCPRPFEGRTAELSSAPKRSRSLAGVQGGCLSSGAIASIRAVAASSKPPKAFRGGIPGSFLEPLVRSWSHFHIEPVQIGPSRYRTKNVKPQPYASFQNCFENPFSEIGSEICSRNFQDEYRIPPRRALRGTRTGHFRISFF